jgi:hypothetical protein
MLLCTLWSQEPFGLVCARPFAGLRATGGMTADGRAAYFLRQSGQKGRRGGPTNLCRSTAPTTATKRMISVAPNAKEMVILAPANVRREPGLSYVYPRWRKDLRRCMSHAVAAAMN